MNKLKSSKYNLLSIRLVSAEVLIYCLFANAEWNVKAVLVIYFDFQLIIQHVYYGNF